MAHCLLLVFAATKFKKISSRTESRTQVVRVCFQARPWKCKDARSGTLFWVSPRLSPRPWRWAEARAGESFVFVCLPWWSTLRLSSVISRLMNGPSYVMGGSGATSSQLKETDEGLSANQFKKKKTTLILTSGYKMFFCLQHGCRDGSESVVPPLWSRLKYLYLFISRPDYSGILD